MAHTYPAEEPPWPGRDVPEFTTAVDRIRIDAAKLDLVLDVLRANRLHEGHCAWKRAVDGPSLELPPPCDCWLADS